jgi:hypothetical protein
MIYDPDEQVSLNQTLTSFLVDNALKNQELGLPTRALEGFSYLLIVHSKGHMLGSNLSAAKFYLLHVVCCPYCILQYGVTYSTSHTFLFLVSYMNA